MQIENNQGWFRVKAENLPVGTIVSDEEGNEWRISSEPVRNIMDGRVRGVDGYWQTVTKP